ncbi:hypothetical protein HA402_014924 [Bradysia odoriphaga]|nr:hypothetical protein HA402_014924 [Bradysia odoriphaga]
MGVRPRKYKPFYPTTVGSNLHDPTFQKLPSYTVRPKPDPINKMCSPGPAAYPVDHALVGRKKHQKVPKTIFPADQAHIYSLRIKGKDFTIGKNPGPAAYPFEESSDRSPLRMLASIYPKDKGNMFTMRKKKDEKYFTVSPGPAIYPRDTKLDDRINSIHPPDSSNKFSMVPRRESKLKMQSPGPAVYPNKNTGDISKIATIYPTETQLPPTFKGIYNTQDRQKRPAPNAYPVIAEKHDPKRFKIDFMKKMRVGRKAPAYSLGIRHTPRQHQLILPDDEY